MTIPEGIIETPETGYHGDCFDVECLTIAKLLLGKAFEGAIIVYDAIIADRM